MISPRRHLVALQEHGIGGLGDYAETLVAEALGATRAKVGNAGDDVLTPDGERVQVKCRAPNPPDAIPQWGHLKIDAYGNVKGDFDSFVGVVFDAELHVTLAVRLKRDDVPRVASRLR